MKLLTMLAAAFAVGCGAHEQSALSTVRTKEQPPALEQASQEPYTHAWGNIYPGISVYRKHPLSGEMVFVFRVESVEPGDILTVQYQNGQIEQKDRKMLYNEMYRVLRSEADAMNKAL